MELHVITNIGNTTDAFAQQPFYCQLLVLTAGTQWSLSKLVKLGGVFSSITSISSIYHIYRRRVDYKEETKLQL